MFPIFQWALQRRRNCIAGVTLPPLTLAHMYWLYAWGSPFVCGGMRGAGDFALALWTCSRPCWPFARIMYQVCRGDAERFQIRLCRRYSRLALWAKVRRKEYSITQHITSDMARLDEWIRWHTELPPRFFPETKIPQHGLCAPWPMAVAVQVMPMLGERQTWTYPLPLVLAYKIAHDNAQGDQSWKSELEELRGYANASSAESN